MIPEDQIQPGWWKVPRINLGSRHSPSEILSPTPARLSSLWWVDEYSVCVGTVIQSNLLLQWNTRARWRKNSTQSNRNTGGTTMDSTEEQQCVPILTFGASFYTAPVKEALWNMLVRPLPHLALTNQLRVSPPPAKIQWFFIVTHS